MAPIPTVRFRSALAGVAVALVVAGICGCDGLGLFPSTPVNVNCGVRGSEKTKRLMGVWVENLDIDANQQGRKHTGVRLSVEVVMANGQVRSADYKIGELPFKERFYRDLGFPTGRVNSVKYYYTCDQGSAEVVYDLKASG